MGVLIVRESYCLGSYFRVAFFRKAPCVARKTQVGSVTLSGLGV